MFSSTEYVLAAESAYRREQLLASLPARRTRARRRALSARLAARIAASARSGDAPAAGSAGAPAPGRKASPVRQVAQAPGTPGACAA